MTPRKNQEIPRRLAQRKVDLLTLQYCTRTIMFISENATCFYKMSVIYHSFSPSVHPMHTMYLKLESRKNLKLIGDITRVIQGVNLRSKNKGQGHQQRQKVKKSVFAHIFVKWIDLHQTSTITIFGPFYITYLQVHFISLATET